MTAYCPGGYAVNKWTEVWGDGIKVGNEAWDDSYYRLFKFLLTILSNKKSSALQAEFNPAAEIQSLKEPQTLRWHY